MNNIFTKFFNFKKKLNQKEILFQNIKNTSDVKSIFNAISSHNEWSDIRYVGGCVRKILNNENYDDIDLATNLNPDQVKECLTTNKIEFFETGIKHGTITARIGNQNFEITSLRNDVKTDGRHAEVIFTKDWKEDSIRRDFTINSIYADIDGNLFDPNNGVEDLQNGTVRFIGNSYERIQEDYLRILRYIRFFLLYSKKDHSSEIKKTIKQNISGVSNLSKERLLDELNKNDLKNIKSITVTKPGFINFFIEDSFYQNYIGTINSLKSKFGRSSIGKGKKANVEFVSANPTGPLTVGHGRNAVIGDTVSNILVWNGFDVTREFTQKIWQDCSSHKFLYVLSKNI